MNIRAKLAPEQQLTIKEFLAFTATRPDGERWELIEGVAVLNPSPVDTHQSIVANVVTFLMQAKRRTAASWFPMPGTGTRVPAAKNSLPQPDIFVKEQPLTGSPVSDDAIVIFEVLSTSNTKSDQAWRRRVYASVPNCQHYVTVSLKAVEVICYSRASGWTEQRVKTLADQLDLAAIGVKLPLAEIYRDAPFGGAPTAKKPSRKRRS